MYKHIRIIFKNVIPNISCFEEWIFDIKLSLTHEFEIVLYQILGRQKSNAFNTAKCRLVGNNKDGENFSNANADTK